MWDPPLLDLPGTFELAPSTSSLEREALSALANLSNHILATKASRTLTRLKARHRTLFASPALYARAGEMLASHHYRFAVRKYVMELFDVELDPAMAARVADAAEALRQRRRWDMDGDEAMRASQPSTGAQGAVGLEGGAQWTASAPGGAPGSLLGSLIGGGRAGAEDESEDDDDDDESSGGEVDAPIPVKELTPLVTVRGFLLG